MARSYSINGNLTNTASASAPLLDIRSTTTIRPKVYDLTCGSDATPADQATKYALQRSTTIGTTPVTSITPQTLDPGDPASLMPATQQGTWAANPTLTANAFMLQWAQNLRATFRWVAAPSKEIVLPAAANGLALMSLVTTAAYNAVYSFEVEE